MAIDRLAQPLRAATLAALVVSQVTSAASSSVSTLRQVAVLSRHGVRGPYGFGTTSPTAEQIDAFLTAQAFVNGAFPACSSLVPITKGTRLLFEQGQDPTATCPVCSRTLYEGMIGAPDCRFVVAENRREIEELNTLLDCCAPVACAVNASDAAAASNDTQCTFFDVPTQWRGDFYSPWKDALASADYMAEFLTLLALNNMTIPAPFTFEKILELARIHEAHMDLVTNEVNSENFGGTFLAHLTASFEQTMTGKALPLPAGKPGPKLAQSLDNRFLYYAGHDINLLYVRNLLRLEWYSHGWHPHEPTPGSMLIFELHSSDHAESSPLTSNASVKVGRRLVGASETPSPDSYYVKALFVTASPLQMRDGTPLSADHPPNVVPVIIPECSRDVRLSDGSIDVRCSFADFKALMSRSLKHECVADTLRPFIDSIDGRSGGGSSSDSAHALHLPVFLWVAFVALVAVFVGIVIRHFVGERRRRTPSKQEYGSLPQVTTE
ncbi:hypothetical protein P43SY_003366 [Pythium insidiosum]|uniref:Histidine acid phosphatase n=1 Tax=Pythium insidiosum TaxID=114742 RepID=A0AAD5M033_PYTIN|nr:hypothetical protein P43SY_003366 [Pythium insidiosum]